jgi:hypothetical protein
MPAIQVQAPPLAVDPATRSTLLQTIVDTMPYLPNASEAERDAQLDAAFALIAGAEPARSVAVTVARRLELKRLQAEAARPASAASSATGPGVSITGLGA